MKTFQALLVETENNSSGGYSFCFLFTSEVGSENNSKTTNFNCKLGSQYYLTILESGQLPLVLYVINKHFVCHKYWVTHPNHPMQVLQPL